MVRNALVFAVFSLVFKFFLGVSLDREYCTCCGYSRGRIMLGIFELLSVRKFHKFYDEELWIFMHSIYPRNLINLTDDDLKKRFFEIERNIQYLDSEKTPRDDLPPERGWLSPWWWWRARFWTLMEFELRGVQAESLSEVAPASSITPDLVGTVSGGRKLLVRISKVSWLLDTLNKGVLRFAPASTYIDSALDEARQDDEMKKSYSRPGQQIKISTEDGTLLKPIGDVEFFTRRRVPDGKGLDAPYWMCSFSTDLDPRLFDDFKSSDGEDGCIVIFEPYEFVRRSMPALNAVAPFATKSLFPTVYYDPHNPTPEELCPLKSKAFKYAYQREMRFVLDPEGGTLVDGGPLFVSIGSIADIAAVYGKDGRKISGIGPDNFYVG